MPRTLVAAAAAVLLLSFCSQAVAQQGGCTALCPPPSSSLALFAQPGSWQRPPFYSHVEAAGGRLREPATHKDHHIHMQIQRQNMAPAFPQPLPRTPSRPAAADLRLIRAIFQFSGPSYPLSDAQVQWVLQERN